MTLRRLAAVASATALVAGLGLAAAPSATAATIGGTTTVTTAPGLARALVSNGIVPYALSPASTRPLLSLASGLQLRYGFPITGITADATPPASVAQVNVLHSGGLALASAQNFQRVTLRNFTIDVSAGRILANVGGVPGVPSDTQIPVFAIALPAGVDPGAVPVGPLDLGGVQVSLAPGIAGALNSVLVRPGKPAVFAEGMTIGTARVQLTVS